MDRKRYPSRAAGIYQDYPKNPRHDSPIKLPIRPGVLHFRCPFISSIFLWHVLYGTMAGSATTRVVRSRGLLRSDRCMAVWTLREPSGSSGSGGPSAVPQGLSPETLDMAFMCGDRAVTDGSLRWEESTGPVREGTLVPTRHGGRCMCVDIKWGHQMGTSNGNIMGPCVFVQQNMQRRGR